MITEILPYTEFASMRLSQFVKKRWWQRSKIHQLENWEFMGGIWTGEAIGFTEFLRLDTFPNELGSLAIDMDDLPDDTVISMLSAINLPLMPYSNYEEVAKVMGNFESKENFVEDRVTYNYTVGFKWPYHIDCTVHENDGLIYVVVSRKDILAKCNA